MDLIDSGATQCMIGDSILKLIPEVSKDIKYFDNHACATTINGSTIKYPGSMDF